MKTNIVISCLLITGFALTTAVAVAGVEPSPFITYQGVLRDAADNPLNGGHDMVFRFFDAQAAGNEIIIDEHVAAGTGTVLVQSGMFSVVLGGGSVVDGSGAGSYASLGDVFRDFGQVYLQVEIWNAAGMTWETLSPRTRVFSAAYAVNADHLDGNDSSFFIDSSSTQQLKWGTLVVGSSGSNYGIEALGDIAGGYFADTDAGSYGYAGHGTLAFNGYGTTAGGRFDDSNGSGLAYVGYGDRGIEGSGDNAGGYFRDSNSSGYGFVGYGDVGIEARGQTAGGYFVDSNNGGKAYVGYGSYGIYSLSPAGSYFEDSDSSGYAMVGFGEYGVWALGNTVGGRFHDRDHSGIAWVGYGDRGIWAKGNFAGGTFSHPDNTTFWADVSTPTRKILGSGTVSFVQNHPFDTGKVVVYAAPEGDEVATYTRGSARLVDGVARVSLSETFGWVTNPDVGLTAHVTARGDTADLYVDSLSTGELVVRSSDASSDAAFDYLVYGLRLGFEEAAVVQPKSRDAFLPTREAIEEEYAGAAELRTHNALERFSAMNRATTGADVDLSGSRAMVNALEQQREVVMARLAAMPKEEIPGAIEPEETAAIERAVELVPARADGPREDRSTTTVVDSDHDRVGPTRYEVLPANGSVRPGDVLVLDMAQPGAVRAAGVALDRAVAGCAVDVEEHGRVPADHAALGVSGIVLCRADATFGPIEVGDLLTTSSNPGHAMLAGEYASGAVLGKAVESLKEGTGLIRVLVILR